MGERKYLKKMTQIMINNKYSLPLSFKNMNMNSTNERAIKNYLRGLEENISKKLKCVKKRITDHDIISAIFQLLPKQQCQGCLGRSGEQHRRIMLERQDKIVEQQENISYLRRKIEMEDQLTHTFFKNLMKEKTQQLITSCTVNKKQKQRNPFSLLVSKCQDPETVENSLMIQRSPICEISRSRKSDSDESATRYGQCATSRSKLATSRFQSSEFAQQLEMDEKQKIKALAKLRKLQKFVFQKQNHQRIGGKSQKMWDFGISPTKKRYKEENDNLKVIHSNLVTHIQLLQKFREIPSVEALAAWQQKLKKKDKLLREKSEDLDKKQIEMTKRHSQFLKRQKSVKIL